MASQSDRGRDGHVEVIDLTNETTKHNETITIDDSFVAIEEDDSTKSDINDCIEYPPLSPMSLFLSRNDSSSDSSSLPSRLPSPSSMLPFCLQSPKSTPSPKIIRASSQPSTTKKPRLTARNLYKQSREEAKQLKLKKKEEEKLQKEVNRANAANKALDNCTAKISRNILNLVNDPEETAIKTLFDESMIQYQITDDQAVENAVTWTYKRAEIVGGSCVNRYNDSKWIMVVMQGSEYLQKLLIYKTKPDDSQSLKNFLCDIRLRSDSDIVLIVYNLANHLKSERAKDAKNYRKNFKNRFEEGRNEPIELTEETSPAMSIGTTELQELRLMLEMEFKQQYSDWKLHIEFHERTGEVVQTFVRYTLSIARLATKQRTRASTGLDWAINMDKERAVDPTKSSEDLKRLWMTQLQQFSQITLPIAKAIAAEYPSPFALLDQYKNLTLSEAENLLAELHVQRNLRRQIGANISRRIHCFMTCRDPNVHIGLT